MTLDWFRKNSVLNSKAWSLVQPAPTNVGIHYPYNACRIRGKLGTQSTFPLQRQLRDHGFVWKGFQDSMPHQAACQRPGLVLYAKRAFPRGMSVSIFSEPPSTSSKSVIIYFQLLLCRYCECEQCFVCHCHLLWLFLFFYTLFMACKLCPARRGLLSVSLLIGHVAGMSTDCYQTNTGKHVQSHGAGIIQVNGTYYMIGEDKSNGPRNVVNCYSSTDLVEWRIEQAPLSMQGGDLGTGRVVERPKVLHNKSTRKYVMLMHIDSGDYKEAKVGVATCDTVCGKYTYIKSFQPMGKQSRDMGVFQDEDAAYLLSEDVRILQSYLKVLSNLCICAASKWPAYLQACTGLSLCHKSRLYLAGEI